MALRRKTGGRIKGTPNKRTLEISELLESLDCEPVEGMARIAMDTRNPVELRGRMFSELAQYVFPKRRATEIKTDTGPRVTFNISNEPLPNPPLPQK
jgi:hypothetical protein